MWPDRFGARADTVGRGDDMLHTCRFANLRHAPRQGQRPPRNPTDAYDRLFPGKFPDDGWGMPAPHPNATLEMLQEIAEARRGAEDEPPADGHSGIPAGLAYLGQLVVHDLTFSKTVRSDFATAGGVLANLRSPRLDLDCIYGDGPGIDGYLYERPTSRAASRHLLRIGGTGLAQHWNVPAPLDLPRIIDTVSNGQQIASDPVIADVRNDQHLILSQLTLLFMRLHNRVAALAAEGRLARARGNRTTEQAFTVARRFVVTAYRNIVFHEFLPALLHPDFAEDLLRPRAQQRLLIAMPGVRPAHPDRPRIALELAVAGGRACHALTRNSYTINASLEPAPLRRLLRFSSFASNPELPVSLEWQVDWRHFFEISGGRPQLARRFTPFYSPDLVDGKFEAQFDLGAPAPPPTNLNSASFLDLYRCWATVRSGQKCAEALARTLDARSGYPFRVLRGQDMLLKPEQHRQNAYQAGRLEKLLRRHGQFLEDTPLSYYVLQEAAVLGKNGAHLGPLGSYIVGMGALRALDHTYAAEHDGQRRPQSLPVVGPGVRRMADLIRILRASDETLDGQVSTTI
jgi:hypothetical protein